MPKAPGRADVTMPSPGHVPGAPVAAPGAGGVPLPFAPWPPQAPQLGAPPAPGAGVPFPFAPWPPQAPQPGAGAAVAGASVPLPFASWLQAPQQAQLGQEYWTTELDVASSYAVTPDDLDVASGSSTSQSSLDDASSASEPDVASSSASAEHGVASPAAAQRTSSLGADVEPEVTPKASASSCASPVSDPAVTGTKATNSKGRKGAGKSAAKNSASASARADEDGAYKWSTEATDALVTTRAVTLRASFDDKKTAGPTAWNAVADAVAATEGVTVAPTAKQCQDKWRNMQVAAKV